MKYIHLYILLITSLPVTMPGLSSAADNSSLSEKDKNFIIKAAQAGDAEIAAGKLAATKSSTPEVKQFGEEMVRDHTKAGDELKQIAQAKGVALPTEPDLEQKQLAKKLEDAPANNFDQLYLTEAGVKGHKAAIALFTDEVKNGQDPDLKAYAKKTLPTIAHHYDLVQNLTHAGRNNPGGNNFGSNSSTSGTSK